MQYAPSLLKITFKCTCTCVYAHVCVYVYPSSIHLYSICPYEYPEKYRGVPKLLINMNVGVIEMLKMDSLVFLYIIELCSLLQWVFKKIK